MDPRGFPETLPEFQRAFPTDEACAQYLIKQRWPHGFECPKCSACVPAWRMGRASVVLRCSSCKADISLTAETVMEGTRTPLSTWFWGAYLITTQTPGMSALQFQRQLGIKRYETAFQILHKLRASLFNPARDQIGGEYPVEIDETFVGGRTRGEGPGVHHKVCVVGAVEIRSRKAAENDNARTPGKPVKRSVYAGRLRLRVLPYRRTEPLMGFVRDSVAKGTQIRTDAFQGYEPLRFMGFSHDSLVMGGKAENAEAHLPMIHLVFSNLKTWLEGTHHGVSQHHLQAYLNEFVFRFNRRFYPATTFHSALGLAVHAESPTYDELYSGKWVHAA